MTDKTEQNGKSASGGRWGASGAQSAGGDAGLPGRGWIWAHVGTAAFNASAIASLGLACGLMGDERSRIVAAWAAPLAVASAASAWALWRRTARWAAFAAEGERRNALALEAAGEGLWDWDLDVNLVRHNRQWCRIMGLDEAYLQHPIEVFAQRLHPDDAAAVMAKLDDCLEGRADGYESVHRLIRGDGEFVWVVDRGKVVSRNDKGKANRLVGSIQDITSAHLTQQMLLEAQSIARLGSWHFELATQKLRWSSQHYAIFEIPEPQPESELFRLYRERIHPDDLHELERSMAEALRSGGDLVYDHRVVLDGGLRIKHVQGRGRVVKDQRGRPIALSGTCQDVTETHKRDQELATILETMTEGLVIRGQKGEVQRFNSEALRILGATPERMRTMSPGSPGWSFLHDDGRPFDELDYPSNAALKTGLPVRNRVAKVKRFDGHEFWITVNAAPFQGADETKVALTFTDVSPLVVANRELARFFEVGQDLLFIAGSDGVLKRVNRAFETRLGYSAADLVGRPFAEFVHPDDAGRAAAQLRDAPTGRSKARFVDRWRAKDGSYRTLSWAMDRDPSTGDIYASARDITDELALQEKLDEQRARAIHASKLASLGEMSAGVAHEINNPLAIIQGQLALLGKHRGDDQKFSAKMETVLKAAGRIEKIVKGLKKFSRSSDGDEHKAESLSAIVAESIVLTETTCKRHVARIEADADEGLYVKCDQAEIEQVLVNLINNAVDATKDLEDRWIKVWGRREGDEVVLRVMDSGPGIAPEIERKLFQPFFTTKPVGEGTGLGLSIAKGILDDHRASFGLNRSFANTCFEIRFPAAEISDRAGVGAVEAERAPGEGRRGPSGASIRGVGPGQATVSAPHALSYK